MTLSPQEHLKVYYECCRAFEKSGDFDALPRDVQFAKRHTVISKEITRYLKRIRHTTKAGVRFLLVAEDTPGDGKNHGLPHYHLLIHETGEARITNRVLENRWRWGITHWRLVREGETNKAVGYLCKYLVKSAASRLRASRTYGKRRPQDIALAQGTASRSDARPQGRETSDPQMLHVLASEARSTRSGDEGASSAVVEAISETAHTGKVAVDAKLHTHDQRRANADARLGGPGSVNAFQQLASKGYARRDPALARASKFMGAWVGRSPGPRGPFSDISDSEDADGPLPAFVLEGRSTPNRWEK